MEWKRDHERERRYLKGSGGRDINRSHDLEAKGHEIFGERKETRKKTSGRLGSTRMRKPEVCENAVMRAIDLYLTEKKNNKNT